jgi:hypothetical protein
MAASQEVSLVDRLDYTCEAERMEECGRTLERQGEEDEGPYH